MNAETVLQIVIAAMCSLCTWIFNSQKNSFDAFAKDSMKKIDDLTASINNLNTELARIVVTIEKHGEEINELKSKRRRK